MNLTWNSKNRRNSVRGSQVLEFALVLPLLVFITLAIIEGGFILRIHQVINNAAREGARVGSVEWARSFVDSNSARNVLGEAAACKYLKENKKVFPEWDGGDCSSIFTLTVEPFMINSATSPMYATRGTVRYHYVFKYMPEFTALDLQGSAQFENMYPQPTP